MFVNYSKLAKELVKEMKDQPELLRAVIDIEDAKKEILSQFIEQCLDDLIKLKRIELLEEASELDFIGEMRMAVKSRIKKEIKESVDKILEV
jgi:hypothetical protein